MADDNPVDRLFDSLAAADARHPRPWANTEADRWLRTLGSPCWRVETDDLCVPDGGTRFARIEQPEGPHGEWTNAGELRLTPSEAWARGIRIDPGTGDIVLSARVGERLCPAGRR
jgi:hypothetical protein